MIFMMHSIALSSHHKEQGEGKKEGTMKMNMGGEGESTQFSHEVDLGMSDTSSTGLGSQFTK